MNTRLIYEYFMKGRTIWSFYRVLTKIVVSKRLWNSIIVALTDTWDWHLCLLNAIFMFQAL